MSNAVAIVGMAGRYPGAPDLDAFRELLLGGRDAVTTLDVDELAAEGVPSELSRDPRYVPAAAVLQGIDLFAAGRFGIPPHEAALMDPQQRILLETAAAALEDAGVDPRHETRSIGAFAGAAISTYLLTRLAPHVLTGPSSAVQLLAMTGNDKDYTAAQLAYRLDLKGPVLSVQTACSTSLVAVHLACQSLLGGECELALAGGVSVRVPQRVGYRHEAEGMLSPSGRCRSYGAEADGTLFGSGCGVVVLKRLDDARADGDRIRAVILGSAVNNDGARKMGFSAPSQEQQSAVISEALAVAGVTPDGIGYVEGHGTGTPLGDPIEVTALASVFRGRPAASIGLGSVKSNIGHTETAAGIAGLIKTVLMLEAGRLAPTLHAERANPRIDIERTPFRLIRAAEPWHGPRRAGVSSFGIGGTNAHVVLEAAPAEATVHPRQHQAASAGGQRSWYLPPRAAHHLLGAGTPSGLGTVLHEADLNLSEFSWLADHRVDGRVLLPGAAYVASLVERGVTAIEGLSLTAAVEIPSTDVLPFRLVLGPEHEARWFVRRADRWQPVAEATIATSAAELPPAPAVAATTALDAAAWADRLARNGLTFGSTFRTLTDLAIGERAARGTIASGHNLTAVLDAGLQAVAAAFGGEGSYLPAAFGRLDFHPGIDAAATVTARLEQPAGQSGIVQAGIWWTDASGRTVGRAQRVICRRAQAPAFADPFHRLAWRGDVADEIGAVHGRLEQIAAGFAAQALAVAEIAPRHRRFAALLRQHAALPDRAADPSAAVRRLAGEHPAHAAEIDLVARAGTALPEILAGRQDPLDLLFSRNGPEGAYAESPLARTVNATVAAVVAGLRPRRVLEIGAGTGATTAVVLPALPPDAEYLFTDVGVAFLRAAETRFGSRAGFRTGLLDIGRHPDQQGLAGERFDLIVAANVLHVAPALRAAVAHAAALLAPGGRLVLVEGTAPLARLDIAFGGTEGWWAFADTDLRPDHPLLGTDGWRALLHEAGLEAPTAVLEAGTQLVLTAYRPPASRWIAIGDAAMQVRGLGLHHAQQLPDSPLDGVVALAGLGGASAAEILDELVALARSLAARQDTPRLLVPTLSAERVATGERANADAAALTGFVRTLALEHPELRPRSVDVADLADLGAALAAEILLQDGEDRTAWRAGRRWRARLEQVAPAAHATWRLTPALDREPVAEPVAGPNQVVVQVRAAGLNFKDVLVAGGLLPGDRLGGECAGEVVAVGPGVRELAPGQPVIAVGGGALAHYLVTDAALVVPKPANLDFRVAAALPIAGTTAWHALQGLRPGQRVLIHSATGGVGQMALRLAQAAGAEIVATAGSDDRRAWLRAQGVAEVHSSRDASFASTRPVDLVLSALAGELRLASLALVAPGGRFVEIGRVDVLPPAEVARLRPDITYTIVELDRVDAATFGRLLRELAAAVAANPSLLPTIRSLPLADAALAFAEMRRAEHMGKLVLLPEWPMRVRTDASYLVTGGRGGIGPDVVAWLRGHGAGAVLTLGRSPTTDPLGIVGDVADPASLRAVETRIAAAGLPPLRGVVHAAGVLADRAVTGLGTAEIAATLAPKLAGIRTIARIWPGLELLVAFSSAGGILGSPGQANHTAAAAALDAWVAERHARGDAAVAIDWAAWAERGAAVARGTDARLATIGVGTIGRETAFRALDRALVGDLDRLVVLPIDWTSFRAASTRVPPVLAELVAGDTPTPGSPTTPTAAAPTPVPARPVIDGIDALREQVAQACTKLLPPGRPLDARLALTDQGLDSLGALELRNRLGQIVGARLSATLLFDYPSVEALVAHLATDQLGLPAPASTPAAAPAPAPEPQALVDVDPAGLSDLELDAALAGFERLLQEAEA